MILIWVRNVTINLMMLLPAGMMLVVAARLVVMLYSYLNKVTVPTGPSFLA